MKLTTALEEASENARIAYRNGGKWHIESGNHDPPFTQPFERLHFARDYLFAIRAIYAACKVMGVNYDYMLAVDALKLSGTPKQRAIKLLRKKGHHDMDG